MKSCRRHPKEPLRSRPEVSFMVHLKCDGNLGYYRLFFKASMSREKVRFSNLPSATLDDTYVRFLEAIHNFGG